MFYIANNFTFESNGGILQNCSNLAYFRGPFTSFLIFGQHTRAGNVWRYECYLCQLFKTLLNLAIHIFKRFFIHSWFIEFIFYAELSKSWTYHPTPWKRWLVWKKTFQEILCGITDTSTRIVNRYLSIKGSQIV